MTATPQSLSPGCLFVISAPSGAGKTTLCNRLRAHFKDLLYSVSHTTRPPRPGEKDGIDYFFVDVKTFETGIKQGKWAEWARVHDNYYGTSAAFIGSALNDGKHILLDIDVQGADQIVKRFPQSITIFIMPPSTKELVRRLDKRGTDSDAVIAKRMAAADKEMAQKDHYRHIIVNDDLDKASARLVEIVGGYRNKGGHKPKG
jgi:guanylate kinase